MIYKKRINIVLLLLVMLLPLVYAAPPITTINVPSDLQVQPIDIPYVQANKPFVLHVHAFNQSGYPLTNKTTSCNLHLYDSFSNYEHIVNQSMDFDSLETEWEYDSSLTTNPVSTLKAGEYSYLIWCNNSISGGFSEGVIEVNTLGNAFSIEKSIVYVLMFIFISLIVLGLFVAGLYLPSHNKSDETTGYIIAISNMKYVKIFCYCFAYLGFIVITFMGYQMCYAFLTMPLLAQVLYIVWWIEMALVIPLFIVGLYILIANWIRDNKLADGLQRGFRIK